MTDQFARDDYLKWLGLVEAFARLHEPFLSPDSQGKEAAQTVAAAQEKRILVCSPHPDDESLTSGLALRLQHESGAQVTNLALTLGSNAKRRAARHGEMLNACRVLGYETMLSQSPHGLSNLHDKRRGQEPKQWLKMVDTVLQHLLAVEPDLVIFPHCLDGHPTHIGAHFLMLASLQRYTQETGRSLLTVETEYWQPMAQANLLLGLSEKNVARLVTALSQHQGEMSRNPYHVRQLSRLSDNVRRGSEVIGPRGGAAGQFLFGEIYRLGLMEQGVRRYAANAIILPQESVSVEFLQTLFA